MNDIEGDPEKKTEECKKREKKCSNLKETSSSSDMDGETWECDVCGKRYRLYYEDMA